MGCHATAANIVGSCKATDAVRAWKGDTRDARLVREASQRAWISRGPDESGVDISRFWTFLSLLWLEIGGA